MENKLTLSRMLLLYWSWSKFAPKFVGNLDPDANNGPSSKKPGT